MIKYTKKGLAALRRSNRQVRKNLIQREGVIREQARLIGCNLGFRQNHKLVDLLDAQALYYGELKTLLQAVIHNGFHPAYQVGGRCASK